MNYITIVCLVKLALGGAPAQKLHFEVWPDEIQSLSREWKTKPAEFKTEACNHVQRLAGLPMERF